MSYGHGLMRTPMQSNKIKFFVMRMIVFLNSDFISNDELVDKLR